MSNQWTENCIHKLMELKGRSIEQVFIIEMAFIEEDQSGKPVFEHPACPFLQAHVLDLHFAHGEPVRIQVYQTDNWSMGPAPVDNRWQSGVRKEDAPSIFRRREMENFPRGEITSVFITQNRDMDIEEINLVIEHHPILLKSGEVCENSDGTISVLSNDESVLVFLNSNDVNRVSFNKTIN